MAENKSIWSKMFKNNTGENYSWRKILTAEAAILFGLSTLGLIFGLGQKLPLEYLAILTTIITFYFVKHRMNGENTSAPSVDELKSQIESLKSLISTNSTELNKASTPKTEKISQNQDNPNENT